MYILKPKLHRHPAYNGKLEIWKILSFLWKHNAGVSLWFKDIGLPISFILYFLICKPVIAQYDQDVAKWIYLNLREGKPWLMFWIRPQTYVCVLYVDAMDVWFSKEPIRKWLPLGWIKHFPISEIYSLSKKNRRDRAVNFHAFKTPKYKYFTYPSLIAPLSNQWPNNMYERDRAFRTGHMRLIQTTFFLPLLLWQYTNWTGYERLCMYFSLSFQ